MAYTTQLELDLIVEGDTDWADQAHSNLQIIDDKCLGRRMTNRSGQSLARGMAVVQVAGYDESVTITSERNVTEPVLICHDVSVADGDAGIFIVAGHVSWVQVYGSVVRKQYLYTSVVPGELYGADAMGQGCVGVALTNSSGGYVSALLTGVAGAGTGALTANLLNAGSDTAYEGDVVVVGSLSESFTLTTLVGHSKVIGIVLESSIAVGRRGLIALLGYVSRVLVAGAVQVGDWLRTSDTMGYAEARDTFGPGVFALALQPSLYGGYISAALIGTTDAGDGKAFVWYVSGALAVGADQSAQLASPIDGMLVETHAKLKTAPTGSPIRIDIRKGRSGSGTAVSVYSGPGYFEIPVGQREAIMVGGFADVEFQKDDWFTFDIDQVGSVLAGAALTLQLRWRTG